MKIILEISRHEMLRRWAIGEVFSQFYANPSDEHRRETMRLLRSGESRQEIDGINRALSRRFQYANSLPVDTRWSLATLSVDQADFSKLYTIKQEEWVQRSSGTKRLSDAAGFLQTNRGADPRLDGIISAFAAGGVELQGITLFGKDKGGPLTIVEGTGRLVSLYLNCVIAHSEQCQKEIEVVLGLSPTLWARS